MEAEQLGSAVHDRQHAVGRGAFSGQRLWIVRGLQLVEPHQFDAARLARQLRGALEFALHDAVDLQNRQRRMARLGQIPRDARERVALQAPVENNGREDCLIDAWLRGGLAGRLRGRGALCHGTASQREGRGDRGGRRQ